MNYSKGISWFDDCRIPFVEADSNINFDRPRTRESVNEDWVLKQAHDYTNPEYKEYNTQGRFPPNLLCSDDMLNDGIISGVNKNYIHSGGSIEQKIYGNGKGIPLKANRNIISDKGSNSRYYDIDKWFDKMINEL